MRIYRECWHKSQDVPSLIKIIKFAKRETESTSKISSHHARLYVVYTSCSSMLNIITLQSYQHKSQVSCVFLFFQTSTVIISGVNTRMTLFSLPLFLPIPCLPLVCTCISLGSLFLVVLSLREV